MSQPRRFPPHTPTTPTRAVEQTVEASLCSIAGTLGALGDVWSILVLREMFFGVHRFNDMLSDLGISRSVLTSRLTYRFRAPQRGEVVVLPDPLNPSQTISRRVVGLPGERLELIGGWLRA